METYSGPSAFLEYNWRLAWRATRRESCSVGGFILNTGTRATALSVQRKAALLTVVCGLVHSC